MAMPGTRAVTFAACLLTLAAHPAAAGTIKVLYDFAPYGSEASVNGVEPATGLLAAQGGKIFYGTASTGGPTGCGVVFQIAKSTTDPGAVYTAIYALGSAPGFADGCSPFGTLITDGHALYGTTSRGGSANTSAGSVFRLLPPAPGQAGARVNTLHDFTGGAGGQFPQAGLYQDAAGNLYGTTYFGGIDDGQSGGGLVFELSPPPAGQHVWTYTVLHSFAGPDGHSPAGGVIGDAAGNLYGSTFNGGPANNGVVYKLSPPAGGGTTWTESVLDGFVAAGDPHEPQQLAFDAEGNLYGAGFAGGSAGKGAIFRLSPPPPGSASWTETTLLSLSGTDGSYPGSPLLVGHDGTLYGTTAGDGTRGGGTAFALSPPAAGSLTWQETVLFNFSRGVHGYGGNGPNGGLVFTSAGALIGTTHIGGTNDTGVIFQLQP